MLDSGVFNRGEEVATAEFVRAVVTLGAGKDLDGPGPSRVRRSFTCWWRDGTTGGIPPLARALSDPKAEQKIES